MPFMQLFHSLCKHFMCLHSFNPHNNLPGLRVLQENLIYYSDDPPLLQRRKLRPRDAK